MRNVAVAALLCTAYEISVGKLPAHDDDCALCGLRVAAAMPVKSLIKPATADIPDTFHGTHVCAPCAAAFSESRLLTGSLLVMNGAGLRPMVSKESARKEGRPCWRDVIRTLPVGAETVAIITSNTKRRLWTRAAVSVVGDYWRPLFVDGDTDRLLTVSITALRASLDLVESVYALGFRKELIGTSLWNGLAPKTLAEHGLERIAELEAALNVWRGSDELLISLFIAQKEES